MFISIECIYFYTYKLKRGNYSRIAPLSKLALLYHIDIEAGVIDEDNRGNLDLVTFSHSDKPFYNPRRDCIAQLICEKIYHPELEEAKELDDTERRNFEFGLKARN
jgi:dUTPase